MKGVVSALLSLWFTTSARADEEQRVVPPDVAADQGIGWYCFESHDAYVPTDRATGCYRARELCEHAVENIRQSVTSAVIVSSGCMPQKNAAVFSYYRVMHGWKTFSALPSMRDCRSERAERSSNEDYAAVSRCAVVGDTGLPLEARRVVKGTGWFCAIKIVKGSTYAGECARDMESCAAEAEVNGTKCQAQKSAWATTYRGTATVSGSWIVCNAKPAGASRCEEVE